MSKHMKGPWIYYSQSTTPYTSAFICQDFSCGNTVGFFHEEGSPEDADGKLMAKAPEMYDLLKSLLEEVESDDDVLYYHVNNTARYELKSLVEKTRRLIEELDKEGA